MILFHKLNITLLALEVKVGNEIRVFVNPYDYILDEQDYWAYGLDRSCPSPLTINRMDLSKTNAENAPILSFIKNREVN